jgi:hypothetical protein
VTIKTSSFSGDYYLLVSDEVGVATRYELCLSLGNDCTLTEMSVGRMIPHPGYFR